MKTKILLIIAGVLISIILFRAFTGQSINCQSFAEDYDYPDIIGGTWGHNSLSIDTVIAVNCPDDRIYPDVSVNENKIELRFRAKRSIKNEMLGRSCLCIGVIKHTFVIKDIKRMKYNVTLYGGDYYGRDSTYNGMTWVYME